MSTESDNLATANKPATADSRMLVIDIGKRKRKQVKKLRKGEGPLSVEIEQTIEQLKTEGTLDSNAQTVVVVVREKPRNNWRWPS